MPPWVEAARATRSTTQAVEVVIAKTPAMDITGVETRAAKGTILSLTRILTAAMHSRHGDEIDQFSYDQRKSDLGYDYSDQHGNKSDRRSYSDRHGNERDRRSYSDRRGSKSDRVHDYSDQYGNESDRRSIAEKGNLENFTRVDL